MFRIMFICLVSGCAGRVFAAGPTTAPAAILQEMKAFREMGSVLYIAAHPDDENTQLITYLARGRGYRTAYLSLTRGDGGQNLLGPEFGEELGVIRTQELLAARNLDGGRQFFSRAIDFGFSKDYRETLGIWDRQAVLSDIVRVIREFRPDVMVTRFPPQPGNTHGHHTASAVLGLEAFKLAGDPKAFPEQLDKLTVWQPKRIFMNSGGFGRGGGGNEGNVIRIDVGGNDPVLGVSFWAIAARSRSMHKTQGFGGFNGGVGGGGPRMEAFQLLDGAPATKDLLDGVETTWARVDGGAEITKQIDDVIEKFNPDDRAASVPGILEIRKHLSTLASDPLVNDKRLQLDRILQDCLGLAVETEIPNAEVVPGEEMKLRHTVSETSSVPVKWVGVRYPTISKEVNEAIDLHPNTAANREVTQALPVNTALSQPYWLREEHPPGTYVVSDADLIGRPENPPAFSVEQVFEVGGQKLVIGDEPMAASGERRRKLDVIPPVTVEFASEVRLFTPGSEKQIDVEVTAYRDGANGKLALDAPGEWKVSPAAQSFSLAKVGDHAKISFAVTSPAKATSAEIGANAEINGAKYNTQRIEIDYPHIPVQLLQPVAKCDAVSLDIAIRGHEVGYLPGAGDNVADGLEQMGYAVTQLTSADLNAEKLKKFDAVVVGVRALNVRTDLADGMPALFAFAEGGGNVIVQYNRPDGVKVKQIAPFELHLSGLRVTDEKAAMTFLAPEHPVLNTPNKITQADFEGWVQERGTYYPDKWGEQFTPILECNDPGEAPLKGGLLVAKYGKGYFVYTTLGWFRQLPAGVPGAYRLFANIVSLGK
ncbi:MAG TPA: PIG-L family deacetylase [Tepidisphaeraceae bacterium]|nr:PIG-L family deacetylase [Tepidisphaeraceae bacterium]